jgi:hypothetical protein
VTEENVGTLATSGITHLRVPVGFWILGDIQGDEPYVAGEWPYLVKRAAARETCPLAPVSMFPPYTFLK